MNRDYVLNLLNTYITDVDWNEINNTSVFAQADELYMDILHDVTLNINAEYIKKMVKTIENIYNDNKENQ